jgi:hypothetical protein
MPPLRPRWLRLFRDDLKAHRPRWPRPLTVELLEDRSLPAPIIWTNENGGSWNDPNNWDLGRIPANGDVVIIPEQPGDPWISFDGGAVVLTGLSTSEGLSLSGGILGVDGTIAASAPLSFSNGTYSAASIVGGPVSISNATLVATNIVGGPLYLGSGGTLVGTSLPANTPVFASGGALDGVTLAGQMNVTTGSESVTVLNGLTLAGGSITVGVNGGLGQLAFVGTQTLGGTGTVTFGSLASNSMFLVGNDTLTIAPGVTVNVPPGTTGLVGFSPFTNQLVGRLDLQGTFNVDGGGTIGTTLLVVRAASWSSTGTFRATNFGGVVFGGTGDLAGKTLLLDGDGGFGLGSDSKYSHSIVGGTIATSNGAVFRAGGGTTLAGITVAGDMAVVGLVEIRNGLTVDGTATLGVEGGGGGFGQFAFAGSQTLAGNGTVAFAGADGRNGLLVRDAGTTLTIASGLTVRGRVATIGRIPGSGGSPDVSFVNRGTILADAPFGAIVLDAVNWSNEGTVEARDRGLLLAQTPPANFSGGTLTGGTWRVVENGTLRVPFGAGGVVTNGATVVLDGAGSSFINATTGTTAALAGLSANAAGGSLSVRNGAGLTTAGAFSNAGAVRVGNASVVTVNGTYTQTGGSTTLENGAVSATGLLDIQGGSFAGSGTIGASVSNAGLLAPGQSPGAITINGNYTQTATGRLISELTGADPGTGYDQLRVNGTVGLGGTLDATSNFASTPGSSFVLINNNEVDAVTGTFAGLPEGSILTLNGRPLRISYRGGMDGNDVVLTQLSNTTPVLAPIGNRTVSEGNELTFTAAATDADAPQQELTFSLDPGAPAGAGIDPATGVFSWTPTEAQGPGVYSLTIRVTDSGIPTGDDFETISIAVNESNQAPVLAPIGSPSVNEGATLTFTASASDDDLPANGLSFSLEGAPAGAGINPDTGVFTWTPTAGQGSGTFTFVVRVTDDGSPALSDAETITVTVNADSHQPTGITLSGRTASEFAAIGSVVGTLSTTDPDAGDTHTYTLVNSAGGRFAIVGNQLVVAAPLDFETGPTPTVRVRSTDAGGLSAETDFVITVQNVNEVAGFDVQRGAAQRSFVRFADLSFESSANLSDLIAGNRVRLNRFDLNGNNGVGVGLGGVLGVSGNTLSLDFGAQGIGGNRNGSAGNGYYALTLDLDGDGTFETARRFHRLYGDVNGDRVVSLADSIAVLLGLGQSGGNLNQDANGDGVIDLRDLLAAAAGFGSRLANGLPLDD